MRIFRSPVVDLGLPDLPYFTGDPVFQTLSPASRGGSRLEEQISRILLVRLSRHSDDTVTREKLRVKLLYGPSIRI